MNYLLISNPDEIDFMLQVHFQQLFLRAASEQLDFPKSFLSATLLKTFETKLIVDNTEHGRLMNTDFSQYLRMERWACGWPS